MHCCKNDSLLYLVSASNNCIFYYTPNQKLACSVLYLKIINIFLKNNICIF